MLLTTVIAAAAACVLQVFLQRSAVNLLGVVLDVPEFFWSAPDHLQVRTTRCNVMWFA
jgi:uncharacterized Rmd1/YagE family protein